MKIRALELVSVVLVSLVVVSGCSSVPITKRVPPRELLEAACQVGASIQGAQGTATLRASSREASGTFPATIVAKAQTLTIEANNLLGGVEAVISVSPGHYNVQVPDHPERGRSGSGSWGGIPLYWANDLFLGRVPCPAPSLRSQAALDFIDDETLRVRVKGADSVQETYLFRFQNAGAKPWPKSLRWERRGGPQNRVVEFQFEEPEAGTLSPLKWSARSADGEVKVRWKEREVSS